jgi:hypothetical protein
MLYLAPPLSAQESLSPADIRQLIDLTWDTVLKADPSYRVDSARVLCLGELVTTGNIDDPTISALQLLRRVRPTVRPLTFCWQLDLPRSVDPAQEVILGSFSRAGDTAAVMVSFRRVRWCPAGPGTPPRICLASTSPGDPALVVRAIWADDQWRPWTIDIVDFQF